MPCKPCVPCALILIMCSTCFPCSSLTVARARACSLALSLSQWWRARSLPSRLLPLPPALFCAAHAEAPRASCRNISMSVCLCECVWFLMEGARRRYISMCVCVCVCVCVCIAPHERGACCRNISMFVCVCVCVSLCLFLLTAGGRLVRTFPWLFVASLLRPP